MKLWLTTWGVPNHSNSHRIIPSHTLHIRHANRILFSSPHLPRRQLWLNHSLPPCQRSINIFPMSLRPHWTWNLLRLLLIFRNLKHWNHPTTHNYSHRFHRIRPPMGTDIILRGNCNHQPSISHPLHRHRPSRMSLRWILSRQSYPHPIFRVTLHPTFRRNRPSSRPSPIPSRDRVQQPHRPNLRFRQNSISSILLNQRPPRPIPPHPNPTPTDLILPRHVRRPRQLHTRKSTKHPTPH